MKIDNVYEKAMEKIRKFQDSRRMKPVSGSCTGFKATSKKVEIKKEPKD